ncbi:MAG: DUF4398 domain-containing protein [Dokdonella sp.]|uniref:DUF4398 domain-containing protein n=1 Tax=Dokdonella sp. TaxID=2291710 RepID=UPI0025BE8CCB|nr:DUF4398 domain-containing protein [Dokdonella sp.]MBZ0223724.1 DUF4398 domain-containing protein [Dokdonella sp.]MCC7256600.1 DUF4398 domain-containing protein [Dokdonella sp.]
MALPNCSRPSHNSHSCNERAVDVMTLPCGKIHAPFVVLALLALAACGPTKPPVDQLNAAARGLETARSVGAAEFAAADLRAAADHYAGAQSAEGDGDYEMAAQLALQSQADSELAAVRARREQARIAVEKLTRGNAALREDLSRSPAASVEEQP